MDNALARVRRTAARVIVGMVAMAWLGCDDSTEPDATPEPIVVNFRYLSVEVTLPVESRDITAITFNTDDLKNYTYLLWQGGSRRVGCSSNTFLDADDEMISQNTLTMTFKTDPDNVFDVVDIDNNIVRFTPVATGATSITVHTAGATLTDDERSAYITNVTKQVNIMPNKVYELQ